MIAIIKKAFRATKALWRMIGVLYLCNLIFAIILAAGFSSALERGFDDSMLPAALLSGFDATVADDFLRSNEHLLAPLTSQLRWLLALYVFLMTILGGGVVSAFTHQSPQFSLRFFLQDCAHFLGRMLRLLLLSFAVLLIGGIIVLFASTFVFGIVASGAVSEATSMTGFLLGAFVLGLFLFLAILVIDYARVAVVAGDERSVLGTFWEATKFVFGNFLTTTGWQILMLLIVAGLIALYLLIAAPFKMATGAGIVIIVFLQQASVLSRMWTRVATISGQVEVFQSRRRWAALPAILVSPPEKPEPLPGEGELSSPKKPSRRKTRRTAGMRRKKQL